ncbi:MAG: hypothetical protein CM1200mP29_01620 [Verrucomicrobiota bacterium]|nr:MAG: hypothetical protein CM1200mP29_01620 [Verrucomicrobiota bacterium]
MLALNMFPNDYEDTSPPNLGRQWKGPQTRGGHMPAAQRKTPRIRRRGPGVLLNPITGPDNGNAILC